MKEIPFRQKELDLARSLLDQGAVGSLTFSEGTYQVEVSVKEKTYWPFLQLSDEGEILDAFCSCKKEKASAYCVHLAIAYLNVTFQKEEPLHIRFKTCLWNRLCWIASRRHGYRTDCLEKNEGYSAKSLTGKNLFFARALNPEGEKKLAEFIEFRAEETEETSLKFSNLDPEEIALWKQGKPGEKLKYELSFWSDLAKWCLIEQDRGQPYTITFLPKEEDLPRWIKVELPSIELGFYVSKGNWSLIIPSLSQVDSPLSVHETTEKEIQDIEYDSIKKQFHLRFSDSDHSKEIEDQLNTAIDLEGWKFVPNQGFFRSRMDPLFDRDVITKDKVSEFLSQYTPLLRTHLKELIFEGEYPLQYSLSFDENSHFHVQMFLFEKGDLQVKGAAFFGAWVYLPEKGFYPVAKAPFTSIDTEILPHKMADFITRHKSWLNRFEGFQIHLMTVEPEISYAVDENGDLSFSSEMAFTEDLQGVIDLGEWLFLPSRGFFSKRKEKMITTLKAGKKIASEGIPSFIRSHKDELSLVAHFFSDKNPMAEFSLEVDVTPQGAVKIKPLFSLLPEYRNKRVLFFKEYSYVEGEGFSKFLLLHPFLEEYALERTLNAKEEIIFLSRLDILAPWIAKLDSRLKIPKELAVRVEDMAAQSEGRASLWDLRLQYETELGSVELFDVWKAVQGHKKFIFTEAGLLDLSSDRFAWLKSISKKKWGPGGKTVSLSAMEWIRVQMLETISLSSDSRVVEVFEDFHSYQGSLPCSLEGLKSDLRPYQETGLKWLWFLYSYGLSGLLCDEMGLGKTHQAMALISAVSNVDAEKKSFLIVCPTSVIYHWEDLLKRFLPKLKVYTFYGQDRDLKVFSKRKYSVLLTSYGIMRTERKKLSELSFDVAIYDEIQNAKNVSSQTHRALASLQAFMKIGLTGTPIENHIMELKALFDLILPNYLPSDAQFKQQFIVPIEKAQDPEKKGLLSKLVKPFILRRKKTEVLLELPEKTEEIAYCDLSKEQKELYASLFEEQKVSIEKDLKDAPASASVMHVFALLSKLKQVCNHPCLITKEKEAFLKHSSGKWDLFVELLAEAHESGQKVVVFTQYLDMMDMIESYLDIRGIGYAEIRGSTKDRRAPLKKFKEDPECEVFVASLQAAGVGIDLTAASIVIHYDRWWNPAREDQATDRVHRMGQSRGVQVFKLVTKKTVEESIHRLILKKKGILDDVVGFDEQSTIKKLTKQEIFELLSAIEKDIQEG
jgi:superfamily II DNA or RNA helicase